MSAERRGSCPGIATPMHTGDGLLARMLPEAALPIEQFLALCRASQAHGNGIMEVSQRGSLQVRGLCERSALRFSHAAHACGLQDKPGPAILTSPLMGLEPHSVDLKDSVMRLRETFALHPATAQLSPKISIVADGGGRLHLDSIFADIRIRAETASTVHLSIAGTAADATPLGYIQTADMEQSMLAILTRIAMYGQTKRAQDWLRDDGVAKLLAESAFTLRTGPNLKSRPVATAIGVHPLIDGRYALGIALPFGFTEAGLLIQLAQAAAAAAANSIRPAPDRTLLIIGLSMSAVHEICAVAANLGFITQAADARRHIIACAGAPACASALLDTRQLAPRIAGAAAAFLDGSFEIHLSGCVKGCAHPKSAALTVVGPNHLIMDGRAGDPPQQTVAAAELLPALIKACAARQQVALPVGPNDSSPA